MRVPLLAALFVLPSLAQDLTEHFEKKVRPVFATRCVGCHNAKSPKAGLDLTSAAGFYKGGESGPVIDKAEPAQSRILRYLSYEENVKMPPTGKLKDDETAAIRLWIEAGAQWPGATPAEVSSLGATRKKGFTEGQRRFWSFQPIEAHTPPKVNNNAWVKNPIDNFILARMEAKSTSPAPAASKLTLLRRVTFDLTGLPPTQAEMDAFLQDKSPNAYEKLVDRLLASPRYGERWGRHWLDVIRYADSTGADEDHRYPDAWRYRDYVIEAFNQDLPYDRFVHEQLAGDLLPPRAGESLPAGHPNVKGIVATGMLAVGPRLIAEQDKVKMLYDFIDEQVDTTTRAFLGLTVACARCHDHKFDPILTKDYYSLVSIFANSKGFAKIEGTVSQMLRVPLIPAADFEKYQTLVRKAEAKRLEREAIVQDERVRYWQKVGPQLSRYLVSAWKKEADPALDKTLLDSWIAYLNVNDDVRPWMFRLEKANAATIESVADQYGKEFAASQARYAKAVETWKKAVAEAVAKNVNAPAAPDFDLGIDRFFSGTALGKTAPFRFEDKLLPAPLQAQAKALQAQYDALKKALPPEPPMAEAIIEGAPVTQHVLVRGNPENKGEEVARQFPVILAGENQTPVTQGSGRLEFAQWLTSKDHPLTSRVMVNRIWQGHFGEGLVRTPSNFGLLGQKPTHPELLDYLARQFMDEGWSIKRLHKLILTSATYQQSSDITAEKAEQDPENRLWSRYGRRRLDVEEIRDAMLAIDGTLDLSMGGTLQEGTGTDGENAADRMSIDPTKEKRRTVYLPLRRSNLSTLLNLFDFGDATTPGEGRARTNVAPQALFMMNSDFIANRARVLSDISSTLPGERRIDDAFLRIYNRHAEAEEITASLKYVQSFSAKLGKPEAGWQSLYRILLASNEFNYVD